MKNLLDNRDDDGLIDTPLDAAKPVVPHLDGHTYVYSDDEYDYFDNVNGRHDVHTGPLDPLVKKRRIDL